MLNIYFRYNQANITRYEQKLINLKLNKKVQFKT